MGELINVWVGGGESMLTTAGHVVVDVASRGTVCRSSPCHASSHPCCFQCYVQAIFEEFNTLSVIYQQPAALFVQRAQYQLQEEEPDEAQVRCWVCT